MSFYECNILTYLHTEPLLEVLSDLKTALYIRTLTGNKFKISGYTIMTYTREGIMSADGTESRSMLKTSMTQSFKKQDQKWSIDAIPNS